MGTFGKKLARNIAMQYYRRAKLWFLDKFDHYRAALGACLLEREKPLDNADLTKRIVYLYVNANCSSDYHDAALLCMLKYLFGRASVLALLHKPNISIDVGNVLFVRFIRMKTSEEQGLSLFSGTEFETCP
ncbi:Hypothetical protein PHPALM_15624, partial [Phytophthora palmivora]